MNITNCAITGYQLKPNELKPLTSTTIEYETQVVGKVKITIPVYNELFNGAFERYLIAGICKHKTLNNLEPLLIDSQFIREGYKNEDPPVDFEEKCYALLKVLYNQGGKENKEFELNSTRDFSLAYANSEEFCRIVDQLENSHHITVRKTQNMARGNEIKIFMGVKLTSAGKKEAQKALPKMPMINLVNQTISTGDGEVDEKINHARTLFFSEPTSLDKMRSACETLSYVLEPLREDLKTYFGQKDVADFFQIVNTFDIRHNKEMTKNIILPEQLEWVFYTLLNTINTYTKIKNK
jgi:hypothetical protein